MQASGSRKLRLGAADKGVVVMAAGIQVLEEEEEEGSPDIQVTEKEVDRCYHHHL